VEKRNLRSRELDELPDVGQHPASHCAMNAM
jgi:hypothetical protein